MRCSLRNFCRDRHLCCNFCKKKDCWQRCKDSTKDCRFFIDEPILDEDANNYDQKASK